MTTNINASQVGGQPGPSWCIAPGTTDTGYLLVGSFSQSLNTDAGLLWSTTRLVYEMYATSQQGGIETHIPSTYVFQPADFTISYGVGSTLFWFNVASSAGSSFTYTSYNGRGAGSDSSFTYKQEVTIGQQSYAASNTTGSYFGAAPGNVPLFSLSPISSSFDAYPDSTRALLHGNLYGINLHV